jgi:hypothetical protein
VHGWSKRSNMRRLASFISIVPVQFAGGSACVIATARKPLQRDQLPRRLPGIRISLRRCEATMKIYTIGYGGRRPEEFLELLKAKAIRTVVDVRLRPDRSAMGIYVKAKDPGKGIAHLLAGEGIGYLSFVEMGNPFVDLPDWAERYRRLLELAGDLIIERLAQAPEPFCLLCAEKKVEECHRKLLGDFLAARGRQVEHIE